MPCLGNPLATILGHLKSVFPPAAACLAAQGTSNSPNAGLVPAGTGADTDLVWDDDEDEEDQGIATRDMQPPFNHILLKTNGNTPANFGKASLSRVCAGTTVFMAYFRCVSESFPGPETDYTAAEWIQADGSTVPKKYPVLT